MRRMFLAASLALLPISAVAQDWGDLDALLFDHLTNSGTAEASFWLPDNTDPVQARRALGFAYEHIPGSAGNTGIAIGVFVQQPEGWAFAGDVTGVFGHAPRDAVFGQNHVDVVTTMPGPNDPRCCPSVPTRWRIDFSNMTGRQLP